MFPLELSKRNYSSLLNTGVNRRAALPGRQMGIRRYTSSRTTTIEIKLLKTYNKTNQMHQFPKFTPA
jgi:hypothetical protein